MLNSMCALVSGALAESAERGSSAPIRRRPRLDRVGRRVTALPVTSIGTPGEGDHVPGGAPRAERAS